MQPSYNPLDQPVNSRKLATGAQIRGANGQFVRGMLGKTNCPGLFTRSVACCGFAALLCGMALPFR